MPLLLRTSRDIPATGWDRWVAVTDTSAAALDQARQLPQQARRLERAFEQSREQWWSLAREGAVDSGAGLSHTLACGTYGSDFGLMLAWDRLAGELADEPENTLMLCDDPWLFRHLSRRPGIDSGCRPAIVGAWTTRALRGTAARLKLSWRLFRTSLATRNQRAAIPSGAPVILVYGHPESRADGHDAYFGALMREVPEVRRLLHCDCPSDRAVQLAADGRTASLHGWGAPLFALTMPLWRWRPSAARRKGPLGWLVRRAASREGAGAAAAMNRWQIHCQARFLSAATPRLVCWPWENHAWERALCREARRVGVPTIGYQHTVVGHHQLNQTPRANVDGLASLPDLLAANGPAYRDEMIAWDIPAERIVMAGAWRFTELKGAPYQAGAPVFVPLSAITAVATLQVRAARLVADSGRVVLVKDHPMYPQRFEETETLRRTNVGITGHKALSAVIYSTGTSGLEAILLGLPTLRLMADDRLSVDILPSHVPVRSVTLDEVVEALETTPPPPPLDFNSVLAPVDIRVWKSLMDSAIPPKNR